MIEPMLKYEILLFYQDLDAFLETLQQKGLLDIEQGDLRSMDLVGVDDTEGLKIEQVLKEFKDRKEETIPCSWEKRQQIESQWEGMNAQERVDWAIQALEEEKKAGENLMQIDKGRKSDAVWGNYDPFLLAKLAEEGFTLRFAVALGKDFKVLSAQDSYPWEAVCWQGGHVYLLVYGEVPKEVLSLQWVKGPTAPAYIWEKRREEAEKNLKEAQNKIEVCLKNEASFRADLGRHGSNLRYQGALTRTRSEAEGHLRVVEGFLPSKNRKIFETFLDKNKVFYQAIEVKNLKEEEQLKVPVLLKNNRFARLFEPITALFSLPHYGEMDLTPLFAPFFMMFFGFCMGDAGYGALFVIAGLIGRGKCNPVLKTYLTLLCFLGMAAVVFGLLSGTFFGVSLVKVNALAQWKEYFLDNNHLMVLSLVLGGVQILFGMGVRVMNRGRSKGFKYAIGSLGWWVFLVSALPFVFEIAGLGVVPEALRSVGLVGMVMGALAAFCYNAPDKPLWMNLGLGLWNSYGTLTGLVGDLLSYIRLFALGLTGGILGSVFNDLAMQMSGDIPVLSQVVMLLILLFGHSLNMALCMLGSLVHPLRLTFVEFYKNAGFEGGGRPFEPFKIIKH